MYTRVKKAVLFIVGVFLLTGCVDLWEREPDCKVSTKVSQKKLTFPNVGGQQYVEVTPKPFYLIQKIEVGKVGEHGYIYEERPVNSYSTEHYTVRKIEDGRLLVQTNRYYGDKPYEFSIEVKGGDCSKTIYCTIKP